MIKASLASLLTIAFVLLAIPASADAHLIGGNGFASGSLHPLSGLDHLLAMVAVGVIAVQTGGRSKWLITAAFLSFMIVGGLLGINGFALPMVESGIAVSVLLFGSIIALSKKLPSTLAILCVAFFALFHGHAHGTEISSIVNPAFYFAGFILSTALLHATGVFIGARAKKTTLSTKFLQTSGVAMTLAGLLLLIG